VLVSALAGLASLTLLAARRYVLIGGSAALAVAAVLWGWAAAQYPHMLPPDVDYTQAAVKWPVLTAILAVVAVGAVLLLPSLGWLFVLFQRRQPATQ
jgi:cytochrome bd ubiquinol oxidase subunit II